MYNSLETHRTVAAQAFFMKPTLIVVVCSSTAGLKPRIVLHIIAARTQSHRGAAQSHRGARALFVARCDSALSGVVWVFVVWHVRCRLTHLRMLPLLVLISILRVIRRPCCIRDTALHSRYCTALYCYWAVLAVYCTVWCCIRDTVLYCTAQ